jgi:anti-sigma factor RsiW
MKCQDIQQQLLADFLDNELPSVKKAEVDRHLAQCSFCREFLSAVKKVDDPVHAVNDTMPGAHVWAKIREQVEVRPFSVGESVRGWFEEVLWGFKPTFVYGSVVAAMCVALIVPVGVYRQQEVAKTDREMLMQLVYADDNTTTAMGAEAIGSGTVVEHLL